ncbi:hypothetical protein BT96DRAFT_830320 [Gymnopus androsaceus JB14]|uniref:hAT-like transposase RNase-H fold domain-containing protein n=1 Tax=Gymnopus androsaceus JB14 TaxID=1447944 RepID=A0A6A4H628_9AGAR|nr:hypothetical protein BT96DRAFT_830320 [Gymnopus androsaceus JB14]
MKCAKNAVKKDLQLILDVDIRWSSTYAMVDRASFLKLAISSFFTSDDFREMAPTYLPTDNDWELLEEVKAALDVPHLFQQRLSAEKTPTLCDAIPAFEAMFGKWEALHQEYPRIRTAISAGMDKLADYMNVIRGIPAYTLAMG